MTTMGITAAWAVRRIRRGRPIERRGLSSRPARRSDRIRQVDQGVAMAPARRMPREFPKRFLDTRAQTLFVERLPEDRVGGGGYRAGAKPVEGGPQHDRTHLRGARLC